ncbi:MAG: hypothetical protein COB04_17225 [Gammaproteobacteria bacterium]|nr:MAG: hypothetical protein COB04_17225 [Gammaproteobacteria bacterium]
MKNNRVLVAGLAVLFSTLVLSSQVSAAPRGFVAKEVDKVTASGVRNKIPRKAGAVHNEFVAMLEDLVGNFKAGVGRIELIAITDDQSCRADLFLGTDSSYVALYADEQSNAYGEEFYLDHPKLTFKDILFQYRIVDEAAVSLVVNKKKGQYLITREGDQLSILVDNQGKESPECIFDLSDARIFDGETE